jgi:hypothetical protein
MSSHTLNQVIAQANGLTVEEQLRLMSYLLERVRKNYMSHRKWREIRGLARPNLLGTDAQSYISQTRLQADQTREQQWSRRT